MVVSECTVALSSAGVPAPSGNSLDSFQDDNPPHWLKSLQKLTEMDAPSSSAIPNGPFGSQPPPHRAGWPYYHASTNQFHSPPPGFQTALRPPTQTQTDLLQSAAIEHHQGLSLHAHYTHTHTSPIPPTLNQLITTTKLLTSNNIIFHFLCFLSGFLMVGLGKLPQPLLQTLTECIISL